MGTSSKQSPTADSAGMSLDQLSQAFAAMLGQDDAHGLTPTGPTSHSISDSPAVETATADADEESSGAILAADDLSTADEVSPVDAQSILEAMLFVGRPDHLPLTSQQIAGLMRGVSPQDVDDHIRQLNEQYAANGCPYTIASEGAGYRLMLCNTFDQLRQRFFGRVRAARLSQAAVEVLALVAYHEPLTADEVARLRGTPSGHVLSHLVRRKLLRLERTETKPRKAKYYTTRRFLEVFRLRSLDDLPRSEDLERQ